MDSIFFSQLGSYDLDMWLINEWVDVVASLPNVMCVAFA